MLPAPNAIAFSLDALAPTPSANDPTPEAAERVPNAAERLPLALDCTPTATAAAPDSVTMKGEATFCTNSSPVSALYFSAAADRLKLPAASLDTAFKSSPPMAIEESPLEILLLPIAVDCAPIA